MVKTPAGEIPRVGVVLRFADRLGEWRVRWGIGRRRYRIQPGLYAVGAPTPESPVLVSANYKLSFDLLRSQLTGRDTWILVLDTRGINVWCAAGKGTFGTEEIVKRAAVVRLPEVVAHRTLIVPQLGAPGVSAHQVKSRSGFRVVYGPVRAEDLPAFLDRGLKATPEMRRVEFPLRDRLALVPVEVVGFGRVAALIAVGLLLLSGFAGEGYTLESVKTVGLAGVGLLLGTLLAGTILVPALLPWLPGRAFALKGAWVGVLAVLVLAWLGRGQAQLSGSGLATAAWLLFIPAATSYLGMNFTGCSTYTSLSGVLKEMKVAVPLQIGLTSVAVVLWIAGLFA